MFKPSKFSRYENNYLVITPLAFLISITFLLAFLTLSKSVVLIICFFIGLMVSTALLVPAAVQLKDLIYEKKAIIELCKKSHFPEFDIVDMLIQIHSQNSHATIQKRVASLSIELDCELSI